MKTLKAIIVLIPLLIAILLVVGMAIGSFIASDSKAIIAFFLVILASLLESML
jgi:hypothetical protein